MRWIAWVCLLLVSCGGSGSSAPEPGPGDAGPGKPEPPGRDAWWERETRTAAGGSRVLAPRELRALMAAGRARGFDTDGDWWSPKAQWAYEQILQLDPDDVEANAAAGRRTLQSLPGFDTLWTRMIEAKVYNPPIEELLEQYQMWIEEGRPVFLEPDEVEVVTAKMRLAGEHLDRMENDVEYAALQQSLDRIPSQLRGYPRIHRRIGPFLVFFAARDLARIEGESEASENERLEALRSKYGRELEERCQVLATLMADVAKLYPGLMERKALKKDEFFFLWIFGDPEWYVDFLEQLGPERPESAYRCGFLHKRDMWGYLFKPRAPEVVDTGRGDEAEVALEIPDPEEQLRESLAYVAARQLLRHWGRDPDDPFRNCLDRSRAYWLKVGWPAFLAARQVKKPMVGPALEEGWRFGREPPPLARIVERESAFELRRYMEPAPPPSGGQPIQNLGIHRHFVDLSWLLVKHLNAPETRAKFEAYLISQLEGTASGKTDGFAAAFGLDDAKAWDDLEYALYDPLYKER